MNFTNTFYKNILYFAFSLIILLFTHSSLKADSTTTTNNTSIPKIKNISFQEGLPNAFVYDLEQDSLGFVWIATNAGLYRFDGYSFKAYRGDQEDKNKIAGNYIKALESNGKDLLWIGTLGSGIHCLNTRLEKFIDLKLPDFMNEISIYDFYRENDTILWLGTERGLARLFIKTDISEIEFFHLNAPGNENNTGDQNQNELVISVDAVKEKGQNFLWVGINEKLHTFDLVTHEFKRMNTLSKTSYRSITRLEDGNYIAGFWYGGFIIYSSNQERIHNHPLLTILEKLPKDIQVNSINRENDQIWVASENHGLYLINPKQDLFEINQLSKSTTNGLLGSDAIGTVMRDKSGILWLGHRQAGGISQVIDNNNNVLELLNLKPEIKTLNVRDLALFQNRYLLVATMGDGFFIHDLESGTTLQGSDRPGADFSTHTSEYHSILADSRGNAWLGTKGKGVEVFHQEILRKIISNKLPSEKSSFLINNMLTNEITNNYIMSLKEDPEGNIWAGTWRGVLQFPKSLIQKIEKEISNQDLQGSDIITFSHNNLLREATILSICAIQNGDIYLGTRHRGLIVLRNGARDQYALPEQVSFPGFPEMESIYSIRNFDDTLLMACNTGIMKIASINNELVSSIPIERFDYMEPVGIIKNKHRIIVSGSFGIYAFDQQMEDMQKFLHPDNQRLNQYNYNNFILYADTLYVGSYGGISKIHFPSGKEEQIGFPLRISGIAINNEYIKPEKKIGRRTFLSDNINNTDAITLRSGSENIISLDLALMEYSAPSMNQYKYRLEGVHDDFITLPSGQRTITFANLKPSKYTLEIKGFAGNAVPAENDIFLTLNILPPWYQSKLAYLVYFILIASAFYGISNFYILKERQKSQLRIERANRKKSEELYQYKMQFFTNMSHELRTPMSLIIGPLEQLMQRKHSPEDKENLNLISENTNRLLYLLDQILNVRKIDNNKMEIRKKKLDIVDFCKKRFELFKKHAQIKQINYQFRTSQPQLYFCFDPFAIETIIFNLLSNAFKFVHADGNIFLNIDYDSQNKISISVYDSGTGISAENQKYVFDRFFTIDQNTKGKTRTNKGNGIGLSLSKDLAVLHGGNIIVESHPEKGTTFTLTLFDERSIETKEKHPQEDQQIDILKQSMIEIELNTIEQQEKLKANEILRNSKGNLYHIMLIDDNYELLKFLKASLQDKYDITAVSNAEQALESLKTHHPDLIISDIMMPGMNGLELLRHIKGNPKLYNIPVVLLSARDREIQSQEGYLAGADAYISKPFSMGFLVTRINQILNSRSKMKDYFQQKAILSPGNINIEPEEKQFLNKMIEIIEEHIDNDKFGVDEFAELLNMSRAKLYRKVSKITDKSVKEIIKDIRLQRADQLLKTNAFSVNEVAFKVGFINTSYFIKCFKEKYGKTPKELMDEHTSMFPIENVLLKKK
jgi:signal transduction histidine kinase/DNA-binding response OmpR family regulator/ligand-binding sensor domain-containing protein